MVLGIPHLHDGSDLLIMHGWQPLLEGLGLQIASKVEPIRVLESTLKHTLRIV